MTTAVLGKSIGALGWIAGFLTGRFRRRTLLLPLLNDVLLLPGLVRLLPAR